MAAPSEGGGALPDCTTCPAGTFHPAAQASVGDVSLCRDCTPGRYVDDDQLDPTAHAACANCSAGTFSHTNRTTLCSVCDTGRIAPRRT